MIDPTANTPSYRLFRAWPGNRLALQAMQAMTVLGARKVPAGLPVQRVQIPRRTGPGAIPALVIRPADAPCPLPIVLHIHGGGYVMGTPGQDYERFRRLLAHRPAVIVAPAYRRAMTDPYPAALDDCHDAALWAVANAATLGGDPARLFVMGESAGGGLTAALTLRARERRDVAFAAQFPLYGMFDDRPEHWTDVDDRLLLWNRAKNRFGWAQYLRGIDPVPDQAAPARATDLSGLPPTYGFVGDQDLFLDENRRYFAGLTRAGVPTRFNIIPGCYHAAEIFAPHSTPGRTSWRVMLEGYERALEVHHAPQP